MQKRKMLMWLGAFVGLLVGAPARAELMPTFATAPAGWTTDRFEPHSFSNVAGGYQGRADVLEIGISSAESLGNRPPAYQSTFYNTQGRQYQLNSSGPESISADLYIPASWEDPLLGNVRTDMWGVMTDGTQVTGYPIIGFTNYGGTARYRTYDDGTGLWNDVNMAVNYDAWTKFSIAWTGVSYVYSINGTAVHTLANSGSTGFQAVIMQAYNFGDPGIAGAHVADYTAYWSNAIPEPSSGLLVGTVLVGLVGVLRRRFRQA